MASCTHSPIRLYTVVSGRVPLESKSKDRQNFHRLPGNNDTATVNTLLFCSAFILLCVSWFVLIGGGFH